MTLLLENVFDEEAMWLHGNIKTLTLTSSSLRGRNLFVCSFVLRLSTSLIEVEKIAASSLRPASFLMNSVLSLLLETHQWVVLLCFHFLIKSFSQLMRIPVRMRHFITRPWSEIAFENKFIRAAVEE